MAVPLDAAFTSVPNLSPFEAIPPLIDTDARNGATAYGAAASARIDFSRPDAADPGVLLDVIAHNRQAVAR